MTSSQKCFRTVDIDQVGHTARHLTFFEMLGNFSIGDYFKDDAIRFGWEVSTEVYGLDPEKIWITVFEGMEGVPGDDEALERWVEMGVPRNRIQRLGEADNFWKAGPTGPCGPNTELYLDRGPEFGPEGGPAVGGDRYLEYWNLVFMQYDRAADGTLSPLPAKNIDTGAGLERLAAILQDVPSVFDTDAFRPLITWAEGASRRSYGTDARDDRAFRVLADHGRAMTFLADRRRRAGQRGPRLRAAAHHPPRRQRGRAPGPRAERRGRSRRAGRGGLGRGLPGARGAARARCATSWAPRPSSSPARSARAAGC